MVLKGYFGDNSFICPSGNTRIRRSKGIPFIDTMDVIIVSNDTIKISVYEALAGYVEYLGRYMYLIMTVWW